MQVWTSKHKYKKIFFLGTFEFSVKGSEEEGESLFLLMEYCLVLSPASSPHQQVSSGCHCLQANYRTVHTLHWTGTLLYSTLYFTVLYTGLGLYCTAHYNSLCNVHLTVTYIGVQSPVHQSDWSVHLTVHKLGCHVVCITSPRAVVITW